MKHNIVCTCKYNIYKTDRNLFSYFFSEPCGFKMISVCTCNVIQVHSNVFANMTKGSVTAPSEIPLIVY